MVTVAVIGVPIIHINGYMFNGPSYVPRTTDQLRRDLEQMIVKAATGVEVVDLGELIHPHAVANQIRDIPDFDALGLQVRNVVASSDADAVLVVGGDHVAALPFYQLLGYVVRADKHGDAYVFENGYNSGLSGGTYMFYVGKGGFKAADEVWNVGVQFFDARTYNRGFFGRLSSVEKILELKDVPTVGLFDIDVDVLSRNYWLPHPHSTSALSVNDLAMLITKLKPKVTGIFECVTLDKYGYETIPSDVISHYQDIFGPLCQAVAEAAVANGRIHAGSVNP